MVVALPPLPDAFMDCAQNIVPADAASGFMPLCQLTGSEALDTGFADLAAKWGPGDRRAVVSLWTQGYFGRLLRPWLAYGVLHDHWFGLDIDKVRVALSELGTPMRFGLEAASRKEVPAQIAHFIRYHASPLIADLTERTGTSERIHWSNASFAFHRAFRQVALVAEEVGGDETVTARAETVREVMESEHPLFRLTELQEDDGGESRLVRRVCCIRFKLDGLKKCGTACPMRADDTQLKTRKLLVG